MYRAVRLRRAAEAGPVVERIEFYSDPADGVFKALLE